MKSSPSGRVFWKYQKRPGVGLRYVISKMALYISKSLRRKPPPQNRFGLNTIRLNFVLRLNATIFRQKT